MVSPTARKSGVPAGISRVSPSAITSWRRPIRKCFPWLLSGMRSTSCWVAIQDPTPPPSLLESERHQPPWPTEPTVLTGVTFQEVWSQEPPSSVQTFQNFSVSRSYGSKRSTVWEEHHHITCSSPWRPPMSGDVRGRHDHYFRRIFLPETI